MTKLLRLLSFATASFFLLSGVAHADRLDDIKKAGVLRVGVFDSNPPFGSVDTGAKTIVGYDVDFARLIAKRLGVKLELTATNPANRIPLLTSGKVDLIVAAMTITDDRAKVVDFSTPYFVTGQQFLSKKGVLTSEGQLATLRVGAVKGTTEEATVRDRYPQASVVAYDDIPLAFTALRNGNVQTITQDGAILAGLLGNVPDKANYEIAPFRITTEKYGIAVPKGETNLLKVVDATLVSSEQNGQAKQIFNRWFGPGSPSPLSRDFTITASN
ncbi:amino acid ABC transporter substrate-binding protein [Burkholderia sp. WAC0059]|uniref:ABC transporter substrate-binding protein n=1 Tax=Burkholderia sp. WAC0059 TaxID=2066022 RepID=UPI000C7EAA41|nr:ABC transporter substrate-binding protein [Burkholderia sp. WAC0059]PLZ01257.1 amino acid ABC transporter substrate-binding protein [Burkholderia sp. WAC0059]